MPRNKEFDFDDKLEVARDLFWEKGYHATSIHDIVARLELNRSSIYATYGNKHSLFLKCLANYAKLKTNQYRSAGKNATSSFQVLANTIHDVMDQTIKDKKGCLIVRTIFEMGDTDEKVNQLIVSNAVVLENIFLELIDKAKEEGEIREDLSSVVAARYILSGFSGFYQHFIVSGNKNQVVEMVDFMISSFKK